MRVILVDDDELVLRSLKSIMEFNQVEVVGIAKDGQEAIGLYEQQKPNVMLMDIRMKNVNGIEAAEQILNKFPDAKILLLTTFEDEQYITRALRAGCKGYILKQNISHIIPAIKAADVGSMVFDEEIISKIKKESSCQIEGAIWQELSKRDQNILKAVADGFSNKEIATKFYLSEGTVRNYISALLTKLDVRDRTQLAIYYYKYILTNSSGGTGLPK